jgi:formamidopyrimidine-DNA glycosylase
MFELPEMVNLARQMNEALHSKKVQRGQFGNSPHKFVWYNRTHEEFESLTQGKTVGKTRSQGRFLFIPLQPGYVLLLGECGGKAWYHPPGSSVPDKYHLYITFEDDSFFTVTTQMWGAMELYEEGEEQERDYVKGMRTTPIEPEFTFDYFAGLVDDLVEGPKRSAKALLTQDQIIPGLGNAIAQDILFRARLHPKHPIADLTPDQRRALYTAIVDTVSAVIDQGGRFDEYDLYGNRGGYVRIMDKNAIGRPCPGCGGIVEKIQYLGGACYLCPSCQV